MLDTQNLGPGQIGSSPLGPGLDQPCHLVGYLAQVDRLIHMTHRDTSDRETGHLLEAMCDEIVELGGSHDGVETACPFDQLLDGVLGLVVGQGVAVDPDDGHVDEVSVAYLPQQPLRPGDVDLPGMERVGGEVQDAFRVGNGLGNTFTAAEIDS